MDSYKAITLLKARGIKIKRGIITVDDSLPWQHKEESEAIKYLCEEWDFAVDFIVE